MRRVPLTAARLVARPVAGFAHMLATLDGRVLSTARRVRRGRGTMLLRDKFIAQQDTGKTIKVNVPSGNKRGVLNVGAAMLRAFIGPPPTPVHECCHVNGDYRDNRLSNLKWGTRAENMADAVRHGTVVGRRAKLSLRKAAAIRERLAAGDSKHAVAAEFGVSWQTIHDVGRGHTWKERGR